jgi:hypothetical protein
MMHGRMPVIAEGDVTELKLRYHLTIVSSTAAQSPALTASAVPSRAISAIRRIDHGTA